MHLQYYIAQHKFGDRGFITSCRREIAYGKFMSYILEAVQLPREVSVMHCRSHQRSTNEVMLGNRRADTTAKYGARCGSIHILNLSLVEEADLQQAYSTREVQDWKKNLGAKLVNGIWLAACGKPILPEALYFYIM